MTQDRATPDPGANQTSYQQRVATSYYGLLGVQPTASPQQIRQAYRDLSKLYHPDTTTLGAELATIKFQKLNEAYATLSNAERRLAYDQKIGYSSVPVVQTLPSLKQEAKRPQYTSSAYLDATDRPLSPGEMFAIFILGLTFLACLILAIAIGVTRGTQALDPITAIISQPPAGPNSSPSAPASPPPASAPKLSPSLSLPPAEPKAPLIQPSPSSLPAESAPPPGLNPSPKALNSGEVSLPGNILRAGSPPGSRGPAAIPTVPPAVIPTVTPAVIPKIPASAPESVLESAPESPPESLLVRPDPTTTGISTDAGTH